MKKIISLILLIVSLFSLIGCEQLPSGNGENDKLNSIIISGEETIIIGQVEKYTVTFDPINYKDQSVEWATSDESILSITQEGEVTGITESTEVYIYVTSKADPTKKAIKKIIVEEETSNSGIDLLGYTIKIGTGATLLNNMDPFLDDYLYDDKEAKQQAWEEVEKYYNCEIQVVAYPETAEWGPSRWNYIIEQAKSNQTEYDFYVIPDSKISTFAQQDVLIELTDYYDLYGNNLMDPVYVKSGTYKNELYSITNKNVNIYNTMYYNIGLLEQLQKVDPTIKEPAQIFLDGNWTYEVFKEYCLKVQNAFEEIYGTQGKAGDANQEYWAVSGWDVYWWTGLSSNDGEPLADVDTMTINLTTPHKQQSADLVKYLYNNNLAASQQGVDYGVVQWNEGKALFNTGNLWFVNASNRWPDSLWGKDTRYGYVPWPRANDVKFEDIKISLGGTETMVMPVGRDYSGYGEHCTPEIIYQVVVEMLNKTEIYYQNSPSYNKQNILQAEAEKYAHSEASQKAYIYVQNLLEQGKGYFDPFVVSDNPIGTLYDFSGSRRTIKGALYKYINGKVDTWSEAVAELLQVYHDNLVKAYR